MQFIPATEKQINYIRKLDKNGAYDFAKMSCREASQTIDSLKRAKEEAKLQKAMDAKVAKLRKADSLAVYDETGAPIEKFHSYDEALEFTKRFWYTAHRRFTIDLF